MTYARIVSSKQVCMQRY